MACLTPRLADVLRGKFARTRTESQTCTRYAPLPLLHYLTP